MVYTLDIPAHVEAALRAQADAEGKTLDEILVEAIAHRVGMEPEASKPGEKPKRDLSFMRGTEEDARAIEEAHDFFDQIDEEMWR